MFRVLELRDGKVALHEGTDHVGPPPAGVVRWIDLRSQDEAQLELLRERFNFHPLAIEDCARQLGKTLLVLDTVTGSDAERLYERLGWQRCGVIPGYALFPRGGLCSTTVFYRQLDAS